MNDEGGTPSERPATSPIGRGRLIVVLLASVVFTVGDGSAQLIIAPHLQSRGIAPGSIGPIVAGYSIAALVFRFVTGALYRPQTSRHLISAGCLITIVGLLVTAQATSPALLTVAVAAHGTGFAIVSTGVLAAVMDIRAGTNAGAAMGIYTGVIGAGYAIANFLGGVLADLYGTAGTIRLTAILPTVAWLLLFPALSALRALPGEGRLATTRRRPFLTRGMFRVSSLVWLAFFCGLHVNLLSGVIATFFPLYGLAIGLTFTQIGALNGIGSAISSAVRFASGAVFARVPYRPSLPWMVALGSLGTALFAAPRPVFWVLTVAFVAVGVSRGVLRVASAALAMDGSGGDAESRGHATGLYMAGLDLGRIIAPNAGGVSVELVGYAGTFLLSAFVIPAVFFVYYFRLQREERRAAGPMNGPPIPS